MIVNVFEDTYIHGCREACASPCGHWRLTWTLVVCFGMAVLGLSIVAPTRSLIYQQTGSFVRRFQPRNLPSLIVCPFYPNLKQSLGREQMYDYVLGYLPDGRAAYFTYFAYTYHYGNPPLNYKPQVTASEAAAFIQKFNNSLEKVFMYFAEPMSNIFLRMDIKPYAYNVTVEPMMMLQGLCYAVQVHHDFNRFLLPEASLTLTLKGVTEEPWKAKQVEGNYHIYPGTPSDNPIWPPITRRIKVYQGDVLDLAIAERRLMRYRGFWNTLCDPAVTMPHYRYEGLVDVNRNWCETCKLYIPRYRDEYPEYVSAEYCNLYEWNSCILSLAYDTKTQNTMLARHSQPCQETIFDVSLKLRRPVGRKDVTITLRSAEADKFDVLEEYPMTTVTGYLSALGGAAGIFFGISVVAVSQVAFALAVAASSRWLKWLHSRGRNLLPQSLRVCGGNSKMENHGIWAQ